MIPKVILSKDIPSVSKGIPIANLALEGILLPILSTRSFQGKHILLFAWIPTKHFSETFGTHIFLGPRELVFLSFGIQNNLEF